jgi:hypothetical protein
MAAMDSWSTSRLRVVPDDAAEAMSLPSIVTAVSTGSWPRMRMRFGSFCE